MQKPKPKLVAVDEEAGPKYRRVIVELSFEEGAGPIRPDFDFIAPLADSLVDVLPDESYGLVHFAVEKSEEIEDPRPGVVRRIVESARRS